MNVTYVPDDKDAEKYEKMSEKNSNRFLAEKT